MKSYTFGKGYRPHRFCPECSSSILIDFKDSDDETERDELAMNASLFKDINLEHASFTTFDGKNELDPPYEV
ncbi:hypothetical protein B0A55_02979 [Friedmanniomyces simplex]|uniref:CENP-V/GFA domain-containing protein n=1 Tax=Friedmanniomyces simplex TaxID=329884 RepID=A0A4U0XUX3_9PEZI|nr:hypothetical protein B0A55_02979 [Friedmanniomyces simplex]